MRRLAGRRPLGPGAPIDQSERPVVATLQRECRSACLLGRCTPGEPGEPDHHPPLPEPTSVAGDYSQLPESALLLWELSGHILMADCGFLQERKDFAARDTKPAKCHCQRDPTGSHHKADWLNGSGQVPRYFTNLMARCGRRLATLCKRRVAAFVCSQSHPIHTGKG